MVPSSTSELAVGVVLAVGSAVSVGGTVGVPDGTFVAVGAGWVVAQAVKSMVNKTMRERYRLLFMGAPFLWRDFLLFYHQRKANEFASIPRHRRVNGCTSSRPTQQTSTPDLPPSVRTLATIRLCFLLGL